MRNLLRASLASCLLLSGLSALRAEIVAVSSVVFNGYARQRLPDGTYKPEKYVFGEGGRWGRGVDDPSFDNLKFEDIARTISRPLRQMNFQPALKTSEATLLISVYWGTTQGSIDDDPGLTKDRAGAAIANYSRANSGDPTRKVSRATPEGAAYEDALLDLSLANDQRDELDNRNARILGYSEALGRARFVQGMTMGRDLLSELGSSRYFVVLQAYDFETARKHKKLKPLWTTRLSISESGDFAAAVEKMAWGGTRFYGRDSDGLRRRRDGSVDIAPLNILGTVPDSEAPAPAAKP